MFVSHLWPNSDEKDMLTQSTNQLIYDHRLLISLLLQPCLTTGIPHIFFSQNIVQIYELTGFLNQLELWHFVEIFGYFDLCVD